MVQLTPFQALLGSSNNADRWWHDVCAAQLVPQVTELVISELLWLNYSNPEKPVYLYIHSMGSQTPDGQVRLA